MAKKEPTSLKNLLARGRQKFESTEMDSYDFLAEREKLVESISTRQNNLSPDAQIASVTDASPLPYSDIGIFCPEEDKQVLETKLEQNQNIVETNTKQKQNILESKPEQNYNANTDTGVISAINDAIPSENKEYQSSELEQNQNKTSTEVEHIVNKTETIYEQNYNTYGTIGESDEHHAKSFNFSSYDDVKQEQITNSEQNWNKIGTDPVQLANHFQTNSQQIENKTGSKTGTKIRTKSEQISTDQLSISFLTGIQKNSLFYIYEQCRLSGEKLSPPIGCDQIAELLSISSDSVRTSIKRLEEKGFVVRQQHKRGKGGWVRYQIPDIVYKQLVSNKDMSINLRQNWNKTGTETQTKIGTTASSSSSVVNFNNLTTQNQNFENFDWIDSLDLTQVTPYGITGNTVRRCIELYPNLQQEPMEDLVYRFGEFMKNDPIKNKISSPRGFFISLAKQASRGVEPLDYIPTPNESLIQQINQTALQHKKTIDQQAEQQKREAEERLSQKALEAFYNQFPTLEAREKIIAEKLAKFQKLQITIPKAIAEAVVAGEWFNENEKN